MAKTAGKKMLESSLQSWFIRELDKYGWLVIKVTSPNRRGLPDVVVIDYDCEGRDLWVELRVVKKVQRHHELQRAFHQKMNAAGARVCTVIGMEETRKLVNNILHGVPV